MLRVTTAVWSPRVAKRRQAELQVYLPFYSAVMVRRSVSFIIPILCVCLTASLPLENYPFHHSGRALALFALTVGWAYGLKLANQSSLLLWHGDWFSHDHMIEVRPTRAFPWDLICESWNYSRIGSSKDKVGYEQTSYCKMEMQTQQKWEKRWRKRKGELRYHKLCSRAHRVWSKVPISDLSRHLTFSLKYKFDLDFHLLQPIDTN